MVREMLIDSHGIGHAIAIRENGKLKDLFLDPKELSAFYPPSCFLFVKILRRVKERGAYFVKLPNNKEGFLVTNKTYSQGEKIIAMAKIFNEYEKLQKFSDKLKIETKYLILEQGNGSILFSKRFKDTNLKKDIRDLLKEKIVGSGESVSVIVRSSANISSNLNWNDIFEFSIARWKRIINNIEENKPFFFGMLSKEKAFSIYGLDSCLNIIEREGIFELQGIWDEIQNLQSKKYIFGKNSYLIIEQTAAFCAIDVNTGSDLQIKPDRVNKVACDSIAYNIKLRGIGGKIIIDFLPSSKKTRIEIQEKIKTNFASFRGNFKVLGWTKGNNFEIEGARDQIPLKLTMKS